MSLKDKIIPLRQPRSHMDGCLMRMNQIESQLKQLEEQKNNLNSKKVNI